MKLTNEQLQEITEQQAQKNLTKRVNLPFSRGAKGHIKIAPLRLR